MAEGILKNFNRSLEVFSAGTEPAAEVNPMAIRVMKEIGIDISGKVPVNVRKFTGENWDWVITVCNEAEETCPVFTGKTAHRLHIGFEDPAKFTGSDEQVLEKFRDVRDEIKSEFGKFHDTLNI